LAQKYTISQLFDWGKINRKLQKNLRIFDAKGDWDGGNLRPQEKLNFVQPNTFHDFDDLSQEELKFPGYVVNQVKDTLFSTIVEIARLFHPERSTDGFRRTEPYGIDLLDRGQSYFETALRQKIEETVDEVHQNLKSTYNSLICLQNHLVWNILASLDWFLAARWRREEERLALFDRIGYFIELSAHTYACLGKLERDNRIEFYQPALKYMFTELRRCELQPTDLKSPHCLSEVNQKVIHVAGVIHQQINPAMCLKFVRDVQDVQMSRFEKQNPKGKCVRLNKWNTAPPDFFPQVSYEAAKVLNWISFDQAHAQEASLYQNVLESFSERGLMFLDLTSFQLRVLKMTTDLFKDTIIEEQVGRELFEAQYYALADFVASVRDYKMGTDPAIHEKNVHKRFSEFLYYHRDNSQYSRQFIILIFNIAATNQGGDYTPAFGYLDIEQIEYAEEFMRNKEGQKLLDRLNAVLTTKKLHTDPLYKTIDGKIDLFRFNGCTSNDFNPRK
jgi:hypothetical protein